MDPNTLKSAIDYLKVRAIPSHKCSRQLLLQLVEVISISEVITILEIAESGELDKFLKEVEKHIPIKPLSK